MRALGVMAVLFLLAACTVPTASPPPSPTPLPSPTPAPTAPPIPPTPLPPTPTVETAALASQAEAGLEAVQAQAGEAAILSLRYEDLDADGLPEWLAVVQQEGGTVQGFVLDGETRFPLEATNPRTALADWGLGLYPDCEVRIADLTADGLPEIAIFGHGPRSMTLLHLYTWDGTGYRLLGSFAGDGGVSIEDGDGDLTAEIVEGYHDSEAEELVWQVIFTWDGQSYGWTSDRWRWFYRQRPHTYPDHTPEQAVIAFYLALNDRDLPAAYRLLSAEAQAARPYESWACDFNTLLRVDVGDVHLVPGVGTAEARRVAAMLLTWDMLEGEVLVRSWNVEWDVVQTEAGWRLNGLTAVQLDAWPAPYW